MIRRLFTVLLALCLAMPAMAMPMVHGSDGSAQIENHNGNHHDHGDRQQPAHPDPAKHQCIGCIAAFAPAMARERMAPLPGLVAVPSGTASLHPHQTSPEPPPPRS